MDKFKKLNPDLKVELKNGVYTVSSLWGVDELSFDFSSSEFNSIKRIIFPNRHAAMYHSTKKLYEFFFTLAKETEEPLLKRKTKFNYKGFSFETYYSKASNAFDIIASKFAMNKKYVYESRNLDRFKYYYIKDSLPEDVKSTLANIVPVNFYVKGPFDKMPIEEHIRLFKHINFYMKFYDRESPQIIIYDIPSIDSEKIKRPCLSNSMAFPSDIETISIDDSIIDLFEAARETPSIRLKYIFYFQVLEYCAFYHLKDSQKNALNNILKNPDIISKREFYTQRIIDELKESFKQNDDSAKIDSLICTYCRIEDIKDEITANIDFFTGKVEYDGGFVLDPLFDKSAVKNDVIDINLKNIKNNIEKIRNVLVHARESRETRVIKQTNDNMEKIKPYLYLLRRIAEIVAFRMNPIL